MKAIVLITIIMSLTSPIMAAAPLRHMSAANISTKTAVQIAVRELDRRGYVLPVGYCVEVNKSVYEPEVGPTTPLFSVLFFGGRHGRQIQLYLVTIDRRTGEVDFVNNLLTTVEAESPSPSNSKVAVRTATNEIRRRGLPLPDGYTTQVSASVLALKHAPDRRVLYVTFIRGHAQGAKRLYQVATNPATGDVEFVFDFLAGTLK